MSYDFSADDIFEMAEQLERNGSKFYKDAANASKDTETHDFLMTLASMEEEHERTFAQLRADLSKEEKSPTIFDPSGESGLYLKALVDMRVFFEKEIDVASMKEVLTSAVTAEKDSIVFYMGMREMVPGKLGKERLDGIIKEEMGHIRLLGAKLAEYKNR
jgi:rubrerythrin